MIVSRGEARVNTFFTVKILHPHGPTQVGRGPPGNTRSGPPQGRGLSDDTHSGSRRRNRRLTRRTSVLRRIAAAESQSALSAVCDTPHDSIPTENTDRRSAAAARNCWSLRNALV